ncbi:CPBP family intramembrane glutamic endopeptidase [Lederbergia panacisoli]|uniref:CPBP family intramembrane glutamic endopeptidase n=1 Tax=Lederbergia panacisoli TaxID=1255251 RepID=UPI00214D08E4|nr:type II CAAX endopeptidase family protein [Lederbergia panacisoli]MCR2822219.1 CPBP family intramembrane metalloprotease [Lederbergia panacisoli]
MKSAWIVSFIRFPMLIICLLVFSIVFMLLGLDFQFPFLNDISPIYFTIVNVLCFGLLYHLLKKDGRSLKELVGIKRERLWKDILFGFLWLFVLYIPFLLAVIVTMVILFGADFHLHFQTVFTGDSISARPDWLLWLSASISLIFPLLNAPIEELMYRGYAQPIFLKSYQKIAPAIVIPSLGFALQHIMLAPSWEGAVVYFVAFFLWGIGSGIIYYKQKRLFPLIICHFIVNIAFSVVPIIFLITN